MVFILRILSVLQLACYTDCHTMIERGDSHGCEAALPSESGTMASNCFVRPRVAERQPNAPGLDEQWSEMEAIFTIRRPEFIRFLARFGVDAMDAEDITQEVFLRMYEPDRKNATRPERLYDWLLACARNLAISRFRRGCREIRVADDLWKKWERTLADAGCDVEGACLNRERGRKLARAIASLDREEQQCILLRSDGVTFRQIGETLQLPQNRVVYLTRLAMEKLHAAMHSSAF